MKRLSRTLARRLTHEVACWIEYERQQGAFGGTFWGESRQLKIWNVGSFLEGACAIAATILVHVLKSRGYKATIRNTTDHYFVRSAGGIRLDPTWGQFNGRPPRIDKSRVLRGEVEIPFDDMLYAPAGYEANHLNPCWPRHHLDAMNRILRRMGVDDLEVT